MEESEFMLNETISINAKKFWDNNDTKIILAVILLIFFGFSIFIAFNIKLGIVNDEITHFDFSKQFSTTLGIPPELPEAYRYGVYITQSPYLFYWINGRVINIANLFSPALSDYQHLVILRTVNTFYGLGTILFCYLFAKELIKDKWWQLLPPFLLSNTIMFVFLSGGVSYDNLTNLLSMAGLFFLARVFNHRPFLTNSLAWIICIGLGTLTKYAVLPLGLAMTLTWFVFMLKNKNKIFPIKLKGTKSIVLSALMIIVIMGNLAIYGYNLVVYNSLLPSCEDLLTKEKCEFDYYRLRNEKYGSKEKLTILESIRLGYPNPLHYLFYWVIRIMNNTFGIGSHKSYQTMLRFVLHFILFFWTFSLAIVNKKKLSFKNISLILIFAFLFFTVFIMNYKSELNSGFAHFAIHGRYLFPVIGILYVMFTKAIMIIPQKAVRHSTLIFTLFTYLITGPLTFIYRYNAVFVDWFVK